MPVVQLFLLFPIDYLHLVFIIIVISQRSIEVVDGVTQVTAVQPVDSTCIVYCPQ